MADILVDTTKETKTYAKSFVKLNQNGGYDVTCTPRIDLKKRVHREAYGSTRPYLSVLDTKLITQMNQ